jgi:hypothetical protein
MLHSANNDTVLLGSFGIVSLMIGAILTHVKIKNPITEMFPAISMLAIGILILYSSL